MGQSECSVAGATEILTHQLQLRAQSLSFLPPPSLFSFFSPRSSLTALCFFSFFVRLFCELSRLSRKGLLTVYFIQNNQFFVTYYSLFPVTVCTITSKEYFFLKSTEVFFPIQQIFFAVFACFGEKSLSFANHGALTVNEKIATRMDFGGANHL